MSGGEDYQKLKTELQRAKQWSKDKGIALAKCDHANTELEGRIAEANKIFIDFLHYLDVDSCTMTGKEIEESIKWFKQKKADVDISQERYIRVNWLKTREEVGRLGVVLRGEETKMVKK